MFKKINKENNGTITNKILSKIIKICLGNKDYEFTGYLLEKYHLTNINTLFFLVENNAPFYFVQDQIKALTGLSLNSTTEYCLLTFSNPQNNSFIIDNNRPLVLTLFFRVMSSLI